MSELDVLAPIDRAMAYRSKAEGLTAEIALASPAKAEELRKLSRQWLLRAQLLDAA